MNNIIKLNYVENLARAGARRQARLSRGGAPRTLKPAISSVSSCWPQLRPGGSGQVILGPKPV